MTAQNAPNVLTVLRILLVPVLVAALLGEIPNGDGLAAFVFALASVTDYADGYLARRADAISTFGKLMDPIADKLLILAALVALVSLERVEAWVAMVIIGREFAVTATRMAASQQGVVVSAAAWGKVKTCVQVVCVFLLIAVDGSPLWLDGLVYVTVAVTLVSGVDYFLGLRRHLREHDARKAERAEALG
ncbi:MAG: CDP-diacylglycerol--glycerol-3-phosphate 3-phosphatidyltransferase [Actinomycetota bacterium]|nr:CDP-diacylglycerol--glycerol-3-phosphate 3-phosphatidyltransferase [Actinomycetota bacterium]